MNQKEMVEKCKQKGFDVTAPLLYRQGKIHGFLVENGNKGRERYDIDEKKFNKWLSELEVDENFLPISEAAAVHNMSYSALLYQLKKNNAKLEKKGIVHGGLLYAKRTDIERAIASYSRRTKK